MQTLMKCAALAAVVGLLMLNVSAQQAGPGLTDRADTTQNQYGARHSVHSMDKGIVRASDLIGMNVQNNAEEDLGEIEDLAIDPRTGKIEYAAVSMGGFLGLGDKLFAVPWTAIECRPEEGATAEAGEADKVAVLDVDKETLKNAEGFDQDNWPDMSNERWKQENDRHFQAKRPGQSVNQ